MDNIGINSVNQTPDIETDRLRLNLHLSVLRDHIGTGEEPTIRALIEGIQAYPYEDILQMTEKHQVITKSSYSDVNDELLETSRLSVRSAIQGSVAESSFSEVPFAKSADSLE